MVCLRHERKTTYIANICVWRVGIALTTKISASAEGYGSSSTGKQPIVPCNWYYFGDKNRSRDSGEKKRYGGGEESTSQLHVESASTKCVWKAAGQTAFERPLFIPTEGGFLPQSHLDSYQRNMCGYLGLDVYVREP